jgi:hypothetical protein
MDSVNRPPISKQLKAFVHDGILKIAAAMNVTLEEATQAVYVEQCLTLSQPEFIQAVTRTIREWDKPHMMPPIAFILDRSGCNQKLLGEQAWEALQRFVYKNWHPDLGFTSKARLDPATDYAARQCGGLHRIHNAPTKDFGFIRRDFLQAHERFLAEGGEQTKFSQEIAEKTLNELGDRLRLLQGGEGK